MSGWKAEVLLTGMCTAQATQMTHSRGTTALLESMEHEQDKEKPDSNTVPVTAAVGSQ